ncbi:MAG: hypothetical protein WC455_28685 [Dehalococcoidia bacterium]|jgi:hypothetical protein
MTETDRTKLCTVRQVATATGISRSSIIRHVRRGEIDHTIMNKRVMLTNEAAEKWAHNHLRGFVSKSTGVTKPFDTHDSTADDMLIADASLLVNISRWTIYGAIDSRDIIPTSTRRPMTVNRNDIVAWAASYTKSKSKSSVPAPASTPAENKSVITPENAGDMVAGTIDRLVTEVLKLRSDNATLRAGNTRLVASLQRADEALTRRE